MGVGFVWRSKLRVGTEGHLHSSELTVKGLFSSAYNKEGIKTALTGSDIRMISHLRYSSLIS